MFLLFAYLLFINIADYATTKILLSQGQFAEANPFLVVLIGHVNTVDVILYVKLTFVTLLGFMLYRYHSDHYKTFRWRALMFAIGFVNIGLTGVVIRSLYFIHTIR